MKLYEAIEGEIREREVKEKLIILWKTLEMSGILGYRFITRDGIEGLVYKDYFFNRIIVAVE